MSRTTTLERSLEILVPEAWSTDQKGKFLEDIASQILKRQSYEIESRIRFTGMEIDLLATHKPSSDRIYTECKFHSASIGANVIDLMIGQGFRRNISRLCLFSVGPLSKEATGVVDDLKSDGRVSFSFYGANEILEALLNSGAAPELPEKIVSPAISHATLIVHPECPYLWVLQEQKDGRPYRIIPFSSSDDRPSSSSLRVLLDKHQILEGLPISEYPDKSNSSPLLPADPSSGPAEVVGKVTTADTILDYRPCRPEDFVGRQVLQKEIWDFLGDIRQGTTNTRLIALVGASGYGKSSLVSKLSERFRNIKWKDKFYLYPVDVRSARGPLFVAEALLEAIRSAGDAGFVKVPENLEVTDADNIMSSTSILHFLDQIKSENKVLVVFFDQFEEAFTKDELLPVFRVFRRFSLDVQSLGSNLVVGFSWRTGVSFSDDNPAYQLWNELRDHRLTKTLGKFDSAESSALVSQFEKALGVKLLTPLRRRILEQSQGLPWLLKKLCIHIYRQIESGTSQTALLQSRLNVQTLFDDDLEHISETQLSCLKFIAKNSPADSLEVFDKYGSDTVGALVEKRLVIRAGQKFAVYWDIFRDYLAEGKVPAIPWTYIPN